LTSFSFGRLESGDNIAVNGDYVALVFPIRFSPGGRFYRECLHGLSAPSPYCYQNRFTFVTLGNVPGVHRVCCTL